MNPLSKPGMNQKLATLWIVAMTWGAGIGWADVPAPATPPDYASSNLNDAFAIGGQAGPAALSGLSEDEKALAKILLKGSFEEDSEKVKSIDEVFAYIDSLSPGRKLDLMLALKENPALQGEAAIPGMFNQHAEEFRRTMLELMMDLLEPGMHGEDREGLQKMRNLLHALNNSVGVPEEAKREVMRVLSELMGPEGAELGKIWN